MLDNIYSEKKKSFAFVFIRKQYPCLVECFFLFQTPLPQGELVEQGRGVGR